MRHLFLVMLLALTPAPAQLGPLVDVSGRIVVEPAYPPLLGQVFTLTFVNSQGRAIVEVTLRENARTLRMTSLRGAISAETPLRSDGTFLLSLPQGEHRLIVKREPGPNAPLYYVKSVQAGGRDLLEK